MSQPFSFKSTHCMWLFLDQVPEPSSLIHSTFLSWTSTWSLASVWSRFLLRCWAISVVCSVYSESMQTACNLYAECDGGLMVGCGLVDSILLLFTVECKWVFVSKTAPWFMPVCMGCFWKCYCTTRLCEILLQNWENRDKNMSLSTLTFQCSEHFKSDRKLWEVDHHSGCPSASLAKKTCSVPWSVQIVYSMRDGEVRNRSMIVFHRKYVLCVCVLHVRACVQNSIRDLSRIVSGYLWCLQEALQNKQ